MADGEPISATHVLANASKDMAAWRSVHRARGGGGAMGGGFGGGGSMGGSGGGGYQGGGGSGMRGGGMGGQGGERGGAGMSSFNRTPSFGQSRSSGNYGGLSERGGANPYAG